MMLAEARAAIDPDGFARIERRAKDAIGWARSDALNKLTWMVICKGGLVSDITVGDCIELTAALQEHHFRGSAGRPLFYALLKDAGVLPASAPARLRVLRVEGRRSVGQIVDRYGIACGPVRDLLVEYFTERAPDLDHTSLRHVADTICRLFWRDLEIHHPGIGSLRLEPAVAQAWKERLAHIRDAGGHPVRPRVNFRSELVFVRAFYEDIARWAADDPARWAPWVAPSPVKGAECATKKSRSRVKSRMDQRTLAQLPLLPALLRAVGQQRKDAEAQISTARGTAAGGLFTAAGQEFQQGRQGPSGRVYVTEGSTGRRRNLTHEEEAAFWSWATVEILRATGMRIEEMLELTHHSFIAYPLPTTGEIVPMLQGSFDLHPVASVGVHVQCGVGQRACQLDRRADRYHLVFPAVYEESTPTNGLQPLRRHCQRVDPPLPRCGEQGRPAFLGARLGRCAVPRQRKIVW
jgi:hypothetical protein